MAANLLVWVASEMYFIAAGQTAMHNSMQERACFSFNPEKQEKTKQRQLT
jgi:hypothetical protein